ncbi:MAG TPA: (2Fe-2S)-binding protein [Dehalococcoidia bacterium]|nr:(2Fe-2S)-binding protein [Dehalococcoidia bacterium]
MANSKLTVNGKEVTLPVLEGVSLQFALRDDLGLTGTKFGCGEHQCGACTVLLDGAPVRSCTTHAGDAVGRKVTTIEGLSSLAKGSSSRHPLQDAWAELQVPQCGYCQSGQLMEAAAFLTKNAQPSESDIRQAMEGHICRCGTYNQIVKAIQLAASRISGGA